ncbi:MAG: hypothetical protein ACRD0U_06215, partial [Acidimicrobiales bacterium]
MRTDCEEDGEGGVRTGPRAPRAWVEVHWDYFRCTGKPDGAQKVTEYWREGESEPYRVQRTCNWTYEGEP